VGDDGYLLDNRRPEAATRLAAISALFDPVTFRHFERIGVAAGWRCWEVGAGGPAVAAWLAARVGQRGHVLATDIDVRHLPTDAGFDVRRHDVGTEPAPGQGFDLVHARLVLVHVPARARALRTMVDALRPGGWLVIEDADPALQPLACPDEHGPAEVLANRLRDGFRRLLSGRGADLAYGRTLPRILRDEGLIEVGGEGFFPLGAVEGALLEAATIEQLRDELEAAGVAGADEVDAHLANCRSGVLDLTTAPMISAWGRRPLTNGPGGAP